MGEFRDNPSLGGYGIEESRNDSNTTVGESQEQEGGHSGRTKNTKEVHFATLIDNLWSWKCGVGTEVSKVQRPRRKPRWPCEIRFRLLCSIYRARLICVTNDGRKSNGWHCKTTRLRRTSSWCNIRITKVRLEDAPRLLRIPKSECPDMWIRLPRTQVGQTLKIQWFLSNETVRGVVVGKEPLCTW